MPESRPWPALGLLLLLATVPVFAAPESARPRETSAAAIVIESFGLPGPLRRRLVNRYFDAYDPALGGLQLPYKTLDRDHTEYALSRAQLGDAISADRARQTLDAARALLDPEDGGFLSRSFGDWSAPEGEKRPGLQADCLRVYALAALLWPDSEYLAVAQEARRYLRAQLPADSTADNGHAAEALALLYRASRDPADLDAAVTAARWLMGKRGLPGGGFRSGARERAPQLADTLAAGTALLALYRVTGERGWLRQATAAGEFLAGRFRNEAGGYNGGPGRSPVLADNIRAARFLNLLGHYAGRDDLLGDAQHAMKFVTQPGPLRAAFEASGALLADDELGRGPPRFIVIGPKGDAAARALFVAALSVPGGYQRVDWWDPAEPPLPGPALPLLSRPTLYACGERHCTPPAHEPEQLPAVLLQLATIPD